MCIIRGGGILSGKVFVTLFFITIGMVTLSSFIELLVYYFSDESSFFEALGNSSYMTVNKVIKLTALPIFAVGIAIYSDDIEDSKRGIKKSDRNILIVSIVGYVLLRLILLELIFTYDYSNIYSTEYFNTNFYTHILLSAVSTATLLAALYYVVNYLQGLRMHWLVFYGALIIGQVMMLAHQIVLVYLFNRNFSVETEFYKFVMLLPVFILELIEVMVSLIESNSRKEIIKFYCK